MDAHNLESQGAPRTRWSRLFRHADFMKLWTGETVSLFGTRIGSVALSFAAVITLRATPFQMGLLAAAGNVPTLVFSLITGAWVDRLRRRPIMIFADLGRTAILATIPLAALYGALAMRQLYVVMLLAALLDLFFDVAYRAYLPTLVAREDLLDANSKLTASSAVAEAAGFGLCGWLVQWLSAPFAILFDAISFLASAAAIGAIRAAEPSIEARQNQQGIAREIADGARMIWSDRRLRALGITAVVGGFSNSLVGTLYMLFVVNALGFKPATLGIIFAVGGASSLFGALAAQRAAAAFGAGRAMAVGLAINGFALMLLPIAHGAGIASVALLVAQQLIGDGAVTIYIINSVTLIQAVTPHRMLGRVNASLRFVNLSAILVGELVAGIAGGAAGLRPTMVAGAAGLWVTAALLAASDIGSVVSIGESVAIEEAADRQA
ncbi:MAG TPA: MFS transporter [Candidatus Binataceae bacterium]|nr:MFS transporter [Candidatus Binataceae bacterium]